MTTDPRHPPPLPPPHRSIPTTDGLLRADLYSIGNSKPGDRSRVVPLYHLVLVRLRDGRTIADTRKTRHEAWLVTPDAMLMELSIPGDSERHIGIDLRNSTCGEENFRGPTEADVPLDQLATLL